MSLIALPTTSANRRWLAWLLVPIVVLMGLALVWRVTIGMGAGAAPTGLAVYRVAPMDLDVRIVKDGELQAINNIEIQSEVEGQTTIQTLVKEGTSVKKGDVLITLDSSAIRQKIEDTYLEVQKAEADLTNARELREIQISTNNANLEAAEVALTLAQIALKQYVDGTYPQALANAQTELKMAGINLKNQEDKLAQTRALHAKGFVTATAIKDDELLVTTAKNNLSKAETALMVLTDYTHEMELADKQNTLSQADQRVARVKRENAASLSQREADVRAKEQALQVMNRRMERYQEQLAACTITAPADGMVVYATSGDRNAQNALQEGTQVRERQNLLRLPDTSSMKAVVRIAEAQVSRLEEGQRAIVQLSGQKEPIGATLTKISVLADNTQRWWNPDVKEYPVDLSLDYTPASLKPGMGAMCTIYIERLRQVIAVPLTSIYSVGQQSWVFARVGDEQYKPVEVKIGSTNETHAQIVEGISAGQEVKILQIGEGQLLLERAGINVTPPPATQPDIAMGRRDRPQEMNGNGPGGGGESSGSPPTVGEGAERRIGPGQRPQGERSPRGEGGRRRARPDGSDNSSPESGDRPGGGAGSVKPGQ